MFFKKSGGLIGDEKPPPILLKLPPDATGGLASIAG
jgi:hypothetical protein